MSRFDVQHAWGESVTLETGDIVRRCAGCGAMSHWPAARSSCSRGLACTGSARRSRARDPGRANASEERAARVIEMRAAGVSLNGISIALGVKRSTVTSVLKRARDRSRP